MTAPNKVSSLGRVMKIEGLYHMDKGRTHIVGSQRRRTDRWKWRGDKQEVLSEIGFLNEQKRSCGEIFN
jgi:hypothetical protein